MISYVPAAFYLLVAVLFENFWVHVPILQWFPLGYCKLLVLLESLSGL